MADHDRSASSDVVVIGAGISGLRTAQLLTEAGRSVTVVESRDRTGGRLLSVPTGRDTAIDLGASWCWPGEHHVIDLARELGIALHDQHLTGDALYDGPDGIVRLDGNPIDVPSYRFTAGADALTDAIASTLDARHTAETDIRLRSRVDSIATTPAGVVARGRRDDGHFSIDAQHVVIAVAPAIAAATIDFDPPLDDAIASLARSTPVWMGSTTKVVATYSAPFWRDDGLSGAAVSHRGPLRELHDLSGPDGTPAALFGFGSSIERALHEADVIEQLVRLFGVRAAAPDAVHIADWRPQIDGVDRLTNYQTYGHRLYQQSSAGGRIHWSSTETATVNPGHIDGALHAARRAVDNILNPQHDDGVPR